MKGIVEHPWTNKDAEGPVNNHLPQRPSVVLQPNELSLKKMTVYNYKTEDVVRALAHSDTALTPMVCIYHLIEESRRRKITKQSRKSNATASTTATPAGVSNDSAYGSGSPSTSTAPGIAVDTSRPTSRSRHSYVPGYPGGDASSPTGRTPNGPSFSGDAQQQPQHSSGNPGKSLPQPGAYQAQQQQQQQQQQPQTNPFLTPKESANAMQAAALESPSFGATSQYGPPRMRKSSIGSGQISVGSSLNLESSSPFLQDDKRTSWSSRLFAKVRKSMPFLKNRRSQILNDIPPMQQSQMPDQNRKRMSFFQQPLKRFSVAPSQTSLNGQTPQKGRIASYYPSDQHPVPKLPQGSPQRPMTGQSHMASHGQTHQLVGSRPATAHPDLHVTPSSDSLSPPPQQQNRQQQQRRQTDFGPQIKTQQSTPARLLSADGYSNSRKSEPLREPPLAESSSNSTGADNSNGQKKRAQRPLSVMSSRQLTPLRLHPTQSFQSSTGVPSPYSPNNNHGNNNGGPQLPPALTTRVSTSHSMSSNGSAPAKSNVKGLFNLRFTMLGPLDEIRHRLETVMKNKLILYRQTGPCIYVCEYSPVQQGKSKDKMRFDVLIEAVQGQLHTVKMKRYSGNWFDYKKLVVALNTEALNVQL
ncbi:hypothetical protein EC988_001351 [Linderina pennispora]|nr:hypothetical protein EC988_001351 [Linderina pennispora]